ncbi:MAG: type IV pilus modification protein PilV [Nevskiaceae bacterium]
MIRRSAGFTLLEVLITLIILAVGMLGLANLQSKIHVTEIESYQRAQAVLLLQDMADRINSNRSTDALAGYVSATELGTLTDEDCDDATIAAITPATRRMAANDRCQWSDALLGASETRTSGGVTSNVGAMIGARGCIEQVQAPNDAIGVCTPGIYRVTVAWQGLHSTKIPALGCGAGDYGNDAQRRVIAMEITIGLPRCASP